MESAISRKRPLISLGSIGSFVTVSSSASYQYTDPPFSFSPMDDQTRPTLDALSSLRTEGRFSFCTVGPPIRGPNPSSIKLCSVVVCQKMADQTPRGTAVLPTIKVMSEVFTAASNVVGGSSPIQTTRTGFAAF